MDRSISRDCRRCLFVVDIREGGRGKGCWVRTKDAMGVGPVCVWRAGCGAGIGLRTMDGGIVLWWSVACVGIYWMFFSLTRLEADGGLEDDEEDEREDGVVPVLVQAPEQDAQDLEDEEGRHRVLLCACVRA